MRIVCTVTNDLAQDQRMDRICTSLTKAGHDVVLVGRELPTSKPLAVKAYRQHRIFCKNLAGKRFYAEYNYRLWREIRTWEYDVVCSVDLDTLVAGVVLTSSKAHKLVFDAHEWFSETPEVVNRAMIRGVWRGVGRALVPRSDARYTVGPLLAKELEEDYGVPFDTVRNLPLRKPPPHRRRPQGSSPRATEPPPQPLPTEEGLFFENASRFGGQYPGNELSIPVTDRKVVLYQGMFNPGRGLMTAISAIADLPDCELWLVGDGPELGALRRCSEKLGCNDRVWFAGFRPPEELPAITARAWLGLNLLDAVSPSYYFSLANKAFDYLQAGVPSVQMAFPEYVALDEKYKCFVLIDRLEPVRLGITIDRLLSNPAEYEALVGGCKRAAEELVWELEEERLLEVWNKVEGL